jgi:hypothetical protein
MARHPEEHDLTKRSRTSKFTRQTFIFTDNRFIPKSNLQTRPPYSDLRRQCVSDLSDVLSKASDS